MGDFHDVLETYVEGKRKEKFRKESLARRFWCRTRLGCVNLLYYNKRFYILQKLGEADLAIRINCLAMTISLMVEGSRGTTSNKVYSSTTYRGTKQEKERSISSVQSS